MTKQNVPRNVSSKFRVNSTCSNHRLPLSYNQTRDYPIATHDHFGKNIEDPLKFYCNVHRNVHPHVNYKNLSVLSQSKCYFAGAIVAIQTYFLASREWTQKDDLPPRSVYAMTSNFQTAKGCQNSAYFHPGIFSPLLSGCQFRMGCYQSSY